jgi:FHS family L-fucose permease-like MFS transporter
MTLKNSDEIRYRKASLVVTGTFFVWGFSYGLLDVLNKHFQDAFHISKTDSGLLQFAYFFAYFVIAIPASIFIGKYSYKAGIVLGLCIFSVGSLLFVPALSSGDFFLPLVAIFILASGLGCLETAANPYISILGPSEQAEKRLNLAQSICGLGIISGPLVGGTLFFDETNPSRWNLGLHGGVKLIYLFLAIMIFIFAVFVSLISMPKIIGRLNIIKADPISLWRKRNFLAGVVAQFFYMMAQVGIGAFFINYVIYYWHGATPKEASFFSQ